MPSPRVRELHLRDLDRILEIDEAITRTRRGAEDNDLWRLLAETTTCFGAESGGTLVGFVLADVRPWEFGSRSPVGWIIAVGVDPRAQGKGVGRLLGDRVLQEFRRLGVGEIKTLVQDEEKGLRRYFEDLGFRAGSEVVLRRTTKNGSARATPAPTARRARKR